MYWLRDCGLSPCLQYFPSGQVAMLLAETVGTVVRVLHATCWLLQEQANILSCNQSNLSLVSVSLFKRNLCHKQHGSGTQNHWDSRHFHRPESSDSTLH
jgi:hypothetical protein